jgi:glutathione S-transferase
VWDTLAIAEYVAEKFPQKKLWPADQAARARARSVCAEMHSGFAALRSHCGMNIEAAMPDIGAVVLRDQPAARADLARIVAMWSELLAHHGGPLLFGEFSIADAYFAPVCMRIRTYALPVPPVVRAYVERVTQLESVQAWIKDALAEHEFVVFDEPYRARR